jgi:NAD(P) transhydrogenase subunit alpha
MRYGMGHTRHLAAAGGITAKQHEGQRSDGTYTSGNITQYKEGDTINFHFTLSSSGAGSGQMEVRFTGNDGSCLFFDNYFALGSIDNVSGTSPTVSVHSGPTADSFGTSNGEWVVTLDVSFADAGAAVVADVYADADVIAKVQKPSAEEIEALRDGVVIIAFLQPLADPHGVERLAERGVIAFAMESIPRITRAQSMDALSSQATVAGYKAAIMAAERLPKFFPMLMTAAGTVAPAKVLVLGAGVAGLQAIATARRLGAVVSGFDIRPVVREQIESLGARFLDLGVVGEETAGGYARELTPDEQRRQQEQLERRIPDFDVVITTAAVPGRTAPKLVPASAVTAMRDGSVIVDVAADYGGNCEVTEPGREIVRDGVRVIGTTNLAATMPYHASQLYARNVSALLRHLVADGELKLDWDDEITRAACVTRREEVTA